MKNEIKKEERLLWIDEKGIKAERINIIKATDTLNKFIDAAGRVMGPLSSEQKELIRENGIKYVLEEIRKKYPFPNASDEFNNQSLGIDLNQLYNLVKAGTTWKVYQYEQDENGRFTPLEEQKVFESYYHYANTENKIAALELARQLEPLFTAAQEKGFIDHLGLGSIAMGLNYLFIVKHGNSITDSQLVINKEGISKLK